MYFHHFETSQHETNHLKCLPPSPIPHHNYSNSTAVFLQEFTTLLSIAATTPHELLITGDFNIYVDNPSIAFTREFLTLLLSISRLLYAAPAWWGCASAADRERVDRFLRKLHRAGYSHKVN